MPIEIERQWCFPLLRTSGPQTSTSDMASSSPRCPDYLLAGGQSRSIPNQTLKRTPITVWGIEVGDPMRPLPPARMQAVRQPHGVSLDVPYVKDTKDPRHLLNPQILDSPSCNLFSINSPQKQAHAQGAHSRTRDRRTHQAGGPTYPTPSQFRFLRGEGTCPSRGASKTRQ